MTMNFITDEILYLKSMVTICEPKLYFQNNHMYLKVRTGFEDRGLILVKFLPIESIENFINFSSADNTISLPNKELKLKPMTGTITENKMCWNENGDLEPVEIEVSYIMEMRDFELKWCSNGEKKNLIIKHKTFVQRVGKQSNEQIGTTTITATPFVVSLEELKFFINFHKQKTLWNFISKTNIHGVFNKNLRDSNYMFQHIMEYLCEKSETSGVFNEYPFSLKILN
jgi:hypothetical protein